MNYEFQQAVTVIFEQLGDKAVDRIMFRLRDKGLHWDAPAGDLNQQCNLGAADSLCPHCNFYSSFRTELKHRNFSGVHQVSSYFGTCIRCNGKVTIILINEPTNALDSHCDGAWMTPSPAKTREPKDYSEDLLGSQLLESYSEAIRCYQNKLWRATVTECGRALEIISSEKFSKEERQKLNAIGKGIGKQAGNVPENIPTQLFEPLIKLTQGIRLGRQSGAHFNITKPADEEIASEVLDMLEYTIEYLYLLMPNVEAFQEKLKDMEEATETMSD